MFGLLEDIAKAAVAVVTTPVAVVVDTAELVGIKQDSGRCHTADTLGAVVKNLENAANPTSRG